jgi:hypothetical protein
MVEALSGGRWQGSSTLEATATTTLDLSSASQTGTADTKFSVNTSSQQIDWEAKHDGSFDSIWWDLGASAVSDTAWVLHWTLNIDNKPEGNKWLITSLSSSVDSNGRNHRNSNSDSLCLTLTRHNDNGYSYFHIHDTDGASFGGSSNPDSGDGTATYDFPLDTDLFCELRRTSATEYIGTIRTGSHTGTVIGTITGSCASTVTGLRYLQFSNWDTTNVYDNGTFDGYIKDVKLYNNKTSYLIDEKDSLTNVPANTRYEETDTRKIYRRTTTTATFDGKSENDQTDTYDDDIRGEQIQTGHALIGKVITSITLKAQRGGTSGTYKLGLFNATGVLQHQFKTASISTLSSSYAEVTGNDLGSGDTTADRTVGTNYIIGMTNSGDTNNRVQLRQSTTAGRANEIQGKCAAAGSSFVAGGENADLYMEVSYVDEVWKERNTA